MNIIDDTSTQPAQPGSLNFVPADPEIPTITPIAEAAPLVETGVERKAENEPIYEIPKAPTPEPKPIDTLIPPVQAPAPAIPQIVDKSAELTKTHHLDKPHDKLTELADSDEEKFIHEVEAAHGHK
jgi:hypothetical protein